MWICISMDSPLNISFEQFFCNIRQIRHPDNFFLLIPLPRTDQQHNALSANTNKTGKEVQCELKRLSKWCSSSMREREELCWRDTRPNTWCLWQHFPSPQATFTPWPWFISRTVYAVVFLAALEQKQKPSTHKHTPPEWFALPMSITWAV